MEFTSTSTFIKNKKSKWNNNNNILNIHKESKNVKKTIKKTSGTTLKADFHSCVTSYNIYTIHNNSDTMKWWYLYILSPSDASRKKKKLIIIGWCVWQRGFEKYIDWIKRSRRQFNLWIYIYTYIIYIYVFLKIVNVWLKRIITSFMS